MQSQSQDGLAQSQSQSDSDTADERETAAAPRFAHAFVGAVRALGLPARYVTGFLAAGEDRPAAFHAWAEAYDDRLGWIGFDAALGLCPTDRHVRVAAGLDARATLPVRAVPQIEDPVFGIDVVDGATQ